MSDQISTKRRKKGTGSITKKPNGTYLGRISIAGYEPYSCTGTSKKEVEKALEQFKIRTLKDEVVPQRQKLNSYIERWLEQVKKPMLKPASYDRLERTYLNQIKDSPVGRSQLGSLTSKDLQKLINHCSETYSYSTIKKVYTLLNDCFHYAVVVRDLNFNPMEGVVLPKEENLSIQTKTVQLMSLENLKKIEGAMDMTYANGEVRYRYAPAYVLIANSGLRSGEALALTWDAVDFEARTITVKQSAARVKNRLNDATGSKQIITSVKTKSGLRVIPLNDTAYAALLRLREYQDKHHIRTQYVIATASGNMVVQNSFYRIFQNMLRQLEIPPVTLHSLRHLFGSALIKQNVNIKVVSKLMGHASTKITYDTYIHTDLSQAIEAVKKLEEL